MMTRTSSKLCGPLLMADAAERSGRQDRLPSKVFSYSSSVLQSHSLYGFALACQNSHSAVALASHNTEMNSMLFGGLEDGMEEVSAFLISPVFTPLYACCCSVFSGVQTFARV
jgi:hypothetical protein